MVAEINPLKLQIAVCDDDSEDCRIIAEMTKEILVQDEISFQISTYADAAALLATIQSGKQFQILLLDVMMEGLNGMELAAALRHQENHAYIVFISSNREMALRGYEVSAARYLSNPVERERLQEALRHCCHDFSSKKAILLPTERGQRRILLADIVYAETWNRGVLVHLTDEQVVTKLHISELQELLPRRQFNLCHRVYLVNMGQVKTVRNTELELKNGQLLQVSKYRVEELKQSLVNYLED